MGLLLLYYLVFRAYQKEVKFEATISKGVVTETDLWHWSFFVGKSPTICLIFYIMIQQRSAVVKLITYCI